MKRLIAFLIIAILLNTSCNQEDAADPYLIGQQSIGLLTDSTQVKDLSRIFADDSIVKFNKGDEFITDVNHIDIYSKQGIKKLTLSPLQAMDSTSTIASVQIFDSRYTTLKDITILSTFKDIKDNYKISKINNLINAIVISVNEINASFTIDKKELPANLRYDMDMRIEKSQIPDDTKIKYFMIHW